MNENVPNDNGGGTTAKATHFCYQAGELVAWTCMKWDETGVIGSTDLRRIERAEDEVATIGKVIGPENAKTAFDDGFAAKFTIVEPMKRN